MIQPKDISALCEILPAEEQETWSNYLKRARDNNLLCQAELDFFLSQFPIWELVRYVKE